MRRNIRHLTLAVGILFAVALPGLAEEPAKESPPPAAPAKGFVLPQVRKLDLPGGMRVRLVDYGAMPKVAVMLVEQTGNGDEGPNETWLADLTGRLMQEGTSSRTPQQIAREVALMGGSLDVGTRLNQVVVTTDVFSEAGPKAVELVADVVRHPLFPERELSRLKGDMARDLSLTRAQAQALAEEKFVGALYPQQSYGRLLPTPEMLAGYTRDQVQGFYAKNFGAARASLYVVGRFDGAAMEKAIRAAFDGWAAGNPPTVPAPSAHNERTVLLVDRPDAVQSSLIIGLGTIDPTSPDYIPLRVTDALLGGYFSSRITTNIREDKGYTYSPYSQLQMRLHGGSWAEYADVTTKDTGASIHEILGEIDRLRREPPTAAELKAVQSYLAGTFVLRNSSRGGIATQLAFLDLHGLPDDFLRNYVQRVNAVTPADVQKMATQYLDPAKMPIVVVGDRKVVLDQLQGLGKIVE